MAEAWTERMRGPMEHWLLLALAGFMMGLLSGSFGVGGGVVMVPVLVLIFWMDQQPAQGLSLAAMVPIAIAGAFAYMSKSHWTLDWRLAAAVGLAGVIGSLLGAHIAHLLPGVTLRKAFAVFLVLAAVLMFFKDDLFRRRAEAVTGQPAAADRQP